MRTTTVAATMPPMILGERRLGLSACDEVSWNGPSTGPNLFVVKMSAVEIGLDSGGVTRDVMVFAADVSDVESVFSALLLEGTKVYGIGIS